MPLHQLAAGANGAFNERAWCVNGCMRGGGTHAAKRSIMARSGKTKWDVWALPSPTDELEQGTRQTTMMSLLCLAYPLQVVSALPSSC